MIRAAVILAILFLFGCLLSVGESKPNPPTCKDTSPDTCTAPACYPDIKPPRPN